MSDTVFHNFFSVCSLIPLFFMISQAIIFGLVPNKTSATRHIFIAMVYMVIFYLGYFIAAAFYHPLAAYHRWLTLGSVLPVMIHFILFLFHFPEECHPRARLILAIGLYFAAAVMTIVFIAVTAGATPLYNFAGHYWDFDVDGLSKIGAYLIILYLFIFLGIGIWRTIATKEGGRWVLLALVIIMFLSILIPGIANALSREGMLDRGIYQITQDLSTIVGFFAFTVTYFNNTRDRTNFMNKILGISFATFLIVFQGMSYFSLRDLENAYDAQRIKDIELALERGRPEPGMTSLAVYDLSSRTLGELTAPHGRGTAERRVPQTKRGTARPTLTTAFDTAFMAAEMLNTGQYEALRALGPGDFHRRAAAILARGGTSFDGYRGLVNAIVESIPDTEKEPGALIARRIDAHAREITYLANRIRAQPPATLPSGLERILAGVKPHLAPFRDAIAETARASDDPAERRAAVLRALAPMRAAGTRQYRTAENGGHFTAFMLTDPARGLVYEAAFPYREYRSFLHPTSAKYLIMLAAILIVILIGFQFFFLGAFIRPIKSLVAGMHRVKKGDPGVRLPILVHDELGYITGAFNDMVDTIGTAKKQLNDYAENLEIMVRDRTRELEEARDALWGEMELARKIQTALLPRVPAVPGYEIAAHMAPADEVGGDYYDVINFEGINWIVIGDVSGHGVPAGLIMMMVQTAIHAVLAGTANLKPDVLLTRINRVIYDNVRKLNEDKYMTITVMACVTAGRFFFSGLHQDIMIYRAAEDRVETIETTGIWIGVIDDISKMLPAEKLQLAPGDTMLLYTDGITEAWRRGSVKDHRDPEREMFGDERLRDVFTENRHQNPAAIRAAILKALLAYDCKDDVTMVIVKRDGGGSGE